MDHCQNVTLQNSYLEGIKHGIKSHYSRNILVTGNRAFQCSTIVIFGWGSEGLRHNNNWSRMVVYQCVFRGGGPDPYRKAPLVPRGSSTIAIRGLEPDKDLSYYQEELKKIGASKHPHAEHVALRKPPIGEANYLTISKDNSKLYHLL